MITGLYETHIQVSDLTKAVQFYTETLGLQLAHYDETRPIAFLWIGEGKKAMLGLWEQKESLQTRHFAFTCDIEFILQQSEGFLKNNQLQPYNFLKNGSSEPMVLPGCRHWLFISMTLTEINWNLYRFWKETVSLN